MMGQSDNDVNNYIPVTIVITPSIIALPHCPIDAFEEEPRTIDETKDTAHETRTKHKFTLPS